MMSALLSSQRACLGHSSFAEALATCAASTRFVKWSRCFLLYVVIETSCGRFAIARIDSAISNLEGTMAKRKKAKAAPKAAKKTKRKAKKRK